MQYKKTASLSYFMLFNIRSVKQLSKIFAQVLHWMEDAGIQPSIQMYSSILFRAQRNGGAEYAAVIRERLGTYIHPI